MSETSRELLADFRGGSEEAADAIFHRYVMRLTALARVRLSEKIARRIDPEDIVLSAYRSFFVAARDGRFQLEDSGDLWRLLVSITLHKLHRQVAVQQTLKRSADQNAVYEAMESVASREPTAEEVLSASDELEAVLKELPPIARRVVELRLQGETLEAIANDISRNERTVRRILDEVRNAFQQRLQRAGGTLLFVKNPPSATESNPIHERPIVAFPAGLNRLSYRDYVLERFIGSGGSGKVYRVRTRESGDLVAVKFLKKAFHRHAAAVQRFVDEAALIARMDHPGIVKLHGVGQSPQGRFFMVTDWFPAGDLNDQMRNGPIPVSRAVRWIREAARSMDYLHRQGLIHCDLKPSNLLLNQQGGVVVTDFGLARSIHGQSELSIEGTAGYMAYEQAVPGSHELGPWTDIFGLGAVLYALLAGHSPYVGSRPSDVLAKLLSNHPIQSLSQARPEIPANLAELCSQCLCREPAQRPASAQEIAERMTQIEASFTE